MITTNYIEEMNITFETEEIEIFSSLNLDIEEMVPTPDVEQTEPIEEMVLTPDVEQTEPIEEMVPTPEQKKRKNVENNGIELLVAALLSNETIETTQQLFDSLSNGSCDKLVCDNTNIIKCIDDLVIKKNMLQKIITNFRTAFVNCGSVISYSNIDKVYLTGKYVVYPEIVELNKNLDKKATKGDVYVKLVDGTFIAFSVKQSKEATKSNYSVHKLICDKDDDVRLTKIKKEFLVASGFSKHDKTKRDEVNALFYCGVENPYWNEMRLIIKKHRDTVVRGLVENLICAKIPYSVYEFDGEGLVLLNDFMFDIKDVTFEECPEFYIDNKGKMRQCAKMFYKLCINNSESVPIKMLRTEVRWKGNIHSASPQFQMHEI